MTIKHQPASPLPWKLPEVKPSRFPAYVVASAKRDVTRLPITAANCAGTDAAYIAHAANAYPKLIEALRQVASYTGEGPNTTPWRDIVRDLGEDARAALKEIGEAS